MSIEHKNKELNFFKRVIFIFAIILLYSYSLFPASITPNEEKQKEVAAKKYYSMGDAQLNKRKYRDAIQCFDKALEAKPLYKEALLKKGIALSLLAELERALDCYNQALEIDEFYIDALNEKAYILYHKDLFNDSIVCSDLVLERDKKDIRALTNRVASYIKLENYSDAIKDLDALIKLDKSNKDNYLELKSEIDKK